MIQLNIEDLVPDGIRQTDFLHRSTYDETCSRCREPIAEDDVPILLWVNDGEDMYAFCRECTGRTGDGCL